jgi:hypothetical protein
VAVVVDADGGGPGIATQALYINGAPAPDLEGGPAAINSAHQLANLNDVNNWLGRSNWTADDNFGGSFNEFRIYDHALSAVDIGRNFVFGPDETLTGEVISLRVNSTTGQVTLVNNQSQPVNIDYYEITSAGGALSTSGWNSLDDQEGGDPPGQAWDESGGASAKQLSELFLGGGTASFAFPANGTLVVGNAFNPAIFGAGMPGDLQFRFGLPSGGILPGAVEYLAAPAVLGDYNQNGTVDAADYVVWRKSVGGASLPNRGTGITGPVGANDYNFWRARFGATSGAGAGVVAAGVPEPTSLSSLVCCLLGFGALVNVTRRRRFAIVANANVVARSLTALVIGLAFMASAHAGTPDRIYHFGEDPAESPTIGGTPNSAGGPVTLDSQVFNTVGFTDASDLGFTGGPTYFDADTGPLARPGAVGPNSFGLQFNGTSDNLIRTNSGPTIGGGGLGVPAQGDFFYGTTAEVPLYTGITTRFIDGWVRPTGGAGTRRDVINETARFGIFIGADNNWGFLNGTTTVNSSTPAALNTWSHVMHRTFGAGGGAVLFVNGIAVAATPNGYSTADQVVADLPLVFGSSIPNASNQSTNFFQGQLDEFVVGVAGNNTGQVNGMAMGRNWGDFNLATDNQFVARDLMGVNAGDINRDGSVNSTDVNTFVTNWRRVQQVGGVTVGDLNSRLFGDLNMNGTVDIDDAYTLHFALRAAGVGSGLDFGLLGVPEPASFALTVFAMGAFGLVRRRRD